jgi:hypothetical protein
VTTRDPVKGNPVTDTTPSDLDSQLDEREMPTEDVRICLKLNLIEERDAAMADVARIQRQTTSDQRMVGDGQAIESAKARVAELEQQIAAKSITLRLTALDRHEYNRVALANPPRKGYQEAFNSSTFFFEVAKKSGRYVDHAGAEHAVTADQWKRIDKALTDGEYDRLAQAVIKVNRTVGGSSIDFLGDASATTPASSETSA